MDIIRAWKDEEYWLSLTEEQRALLPDDPAGQMELSDADLESVAGGIQSILAFCSGNACNNFQSATLIACL
jgi:mersacidin/lichenicidin family type 2 lantibiotic